MKILAIRIKNLASLDGLTVIDFTSEPLCSSGIFAITGATGAGKSTILDALCLALYNKTPRYLQAKENGVEIHDVPGNTINQGDVRGILRDGTSEGFAEVDFIGIDSQYYKATWSVRRARNKTDGSIQADSISLKNITSNIDIPGKKAETLKEIERLVGLNFEQFTRSVLLAQGDFTAFLKANKDEKSSLLEKLTGTHIYSEISKRIYEKYKSEEQQLHELQIRKEGVVTLTEDELKILQEEQAELEVRIKTLETDLEIFTREIGWHEQLNLFQNSFNEAQNALQLAEQVKTNATQRKQKLFQVEQAQKVRTWVDLHDRIQKQQSEKTAKRTDLAERIVKLHLQKEQLEQQLAAVTTDLAQKNNAHLDAIPLLEKGKELDTLLSEKVKQLQRAQEEFDGAVEKRDKHQKLLSDKRTELNDILDKIKSIEEWTTENSDHKLIAENKGVILSKLHDAQNLLKTSVISQERLNELKESIEEITSKTTAFESALKVQKQEYETLKEGYDTKSKALLLVPVEALNLRKDKIDLAIQNNLQAQGQWELVHSLKTDIEQLKKKRSANSSDYKSKEKALQKLEQLLTIENTAKETSGKVLQKARLAATENVETLRASLVNNEPCPVCGSEDHPYVLHNPQVENVLAEIEAAHNANEKAYLDTFQQHNSLKQECETLKQTMQSQDEEFENKTVTFEIKQQEWEKFETSTESQDVVDELKTEWIAEKQKTLQMKQNDLKDQIQTHASDKQQLEAEKTKIDQLKETVDSLANEIKDNKSTLELQLEQQTNCQREYDGATTSLTELNDTLFPFLMTSDWMERWKKAPENFIGEINIMAKSWDENNENLKLSTQQRDLLGATLKELDTQAKSFSEGASQKEKVHFFQQNEYKDLEKQRNAIFEGRPVQEVEDQFKKTIETTQQELNNHKGTEQQLNIDHTKTVTQKEELSKEINALDTDIIDAAAKIKNWLDEFNQKHTIALSAEDLSELLSLGDDWTDAERNALQAIDEEVTRAGSVMAERNQLLTLHQQARLSERILDDLLVLNSSAKSNAEESKQAKNEISFKLQLDSTNKNKISELLKTIAQQESVSEKWRKLNDVIGSADGKKFRQIAQEYTLDVLLGYGNIHLEALTNRYKIQRIPATLGLQVIDQDMGDEIRTVYSLSGGESFLVSLALALGLASLSSNRMKVESLFIDEGFGSLDPTTLNIAMDALERLHNQGRKVGVISHVQEMTERIPTQIKVSKMSSGKSKIEIV
ncbi:AAA family ATPase [Fluviicola sp.]|uniref:AAA family ATPase n=1 Tax=Fluviicola sp. TaxID=1917219 RepID=UPI002622427F|nr:AAA family ATPase [Fluviicola sp.]